MLICGAEYMMLIKSFRNNCKQQMNCSQEGIQLTKKLQNIDIPSVPKSIKGNVLIGRMHQIYIDNDNRKIKYAVEKEILYWAALYWQQKRKTWKTQRKTVTLIFQVGTG